MPWCRNPSRNLDLPQMPDSDIVIKGAREHNLRDVDTLLPRNQLICLTGVSGSGKSSLAFDTLFAEGQRRYVESLSTFARQFLGQMPKPNVDRIGGLSPSISISQKTAGSNPRSTVGTITEIYDFLRLLFARVGSAYCPGCGDAVTAQTREEMLARVLQLPAGTRVMVLAPRIRRQKGQHRDLFDELLKHGFVRARVDGEIIQLTAPPELDRQIRHNIEVVVDRLVINEQVRPRLAEAVDMALKQGDGTFFLLPVDSDLPESTFSSTYSCARCSVGFEPPTPQLFSFNSPQGMCSKCSGLGELYSFDPELLIPDPSKSFGQGCIELLGVWRKMGRWRRHIYQGFADTIERLRELDEGTMLTTPWEDMESELQELWLWGTGQQHVTFTWRGGNSPIKYGGKFEGIIPSLLNKHRETKSLPHRRRFEKFMRTMSCAQCNGQRLCPQARHVRVTTTASDFSGSRDLTLPEICRLSIVEAVQFFSELRLSDIEQWIAGEVLKEIRTRLQFLLDVGLDYLTLDRGAPTLSGGESQRIRLAGQVGCGLVGVLYILDEPSIGLHPRDNDRLLKTLANLRDLGNTVVVVEHDEATILAADHVIDFGPGAGVRGGEIVAVGRPAEVAQSDRSVTGKYLSGVLSIPLPKSRRAGSGQALKIVGAAHNNLKQIDVTIPLGKFVCVTGVSGSGKSSLVNGIIAKALHRDLNGGESEPGAHDGIEGLEHLDKLIAIDQSPIGRTPRSNPGTYIKVFDEIRKLFTKLPEAKQRGYTPGRFSFNVKGGRCEACQGNGSTRLEMDFLADVWVQCPYCQGHRYKRETLQVKYRGKSIADVLEMDVQQLLEFFENQPRIHAKIKTLHDVGLDYIKLGQPSPTLSGGEAQRIKLARELSKRSTGRTLYLLDEPTTGLHFADVEMLLRVLHNFVDAGNTVLVVEHNLEVVKTADWLIDLGPEGGAGGGLIVAEGAPEKVAADPHCQTSPFLARALKPSRTRKQLKKGQSSKRNGRKAKSCKSLQVVGAEEHNLQGVSVTLPRDRMTVFCGPSGSGKTSLALDTIYAEGQRRYVESLSSYARQYVSQMPKPKVERVEGLSPAVAIEQRNLGHTPRSTVGTVTEIYDYFRVLMARLGTPFCPKCDLPAQARTADEMVDEILKLKAGTRVFLTAPLRDNFWMDLPEFLTDLRQQGYARVRLDGRTYDLADCREFSIEEFHRLAVVVDRVVVRADQRARLADSVESALAIGGGWLEVVTVDSSRDEQKWESRIFSHDLACEKCGDEFERLSPYQFSFNHTQGWCSHCEGLGTSHGAHLELLVNADLTLGEGALKLWPIGDHPVGKAMLDAVCNSNRIPLDQPFDDLTQNQQRQLLYGTGDFWYSIKSRGKKTVFEFQYKGLYPALAESARKSMALRRQLGEFVGEIDCPYCAGSRLRPDAAAVRFYDRTIGWLCRMPLGKLLREIKSWKLDGHDQHVASDLLQEIQDRLHFLVDVGLDYLTLGRGAATLSNGEAQRIRLASQLGSGLCGVLYVLDEPTIGLHPRDNDRLIRALHRLRDLGNTLLVVEHDREVIASADRVCDFGPGAGKNGGRIVSEGTVKQIQASSQSVTGPYLRGTKAIPIPQTRRIHATDAALTQRHDPSKKIDSPGGGWIVVRNATQNNLKEIDVAFPLGTLTAVTGPSGSGKSSLVDGILYPALAQRLHQSMVVPGAHECIEGLEYINKVIRVDQQPLGNSPASNPATYTNLFELIRQLFAQLPESRIRGYTARQFSFNVPAGRCEECEGNGQIKIEMHFLPDIWVPCESCEGKRYKPETLAVKFHGHSIHDILEMTASEAMSLFGDFAKIKRILKTLCDVGLDYLTLGQSAPTLSGGEAQRVKLASELSRPDTGRTLYLLDEPTTGLHFDDLQKLLKVIHRLVDLGNTVVVIEHNLDVIKTADWVIDLGPEAGRGGGRMVACGTPEQLIEYAERANSTKSKLLPSWTGAALKPVLEAGPYVERENWDTSADLVSGKEIWDLGEEIRWPWQTEGRTWHTQDRVGRKGEPCKWDGRILEAVVDRIQAIGSYSETDWGTRTVVEISGPKKSLGWFFHAITGEQWLLKMKFRVPKGTFKIENLQAQLPLKTLNQLDELPIYGNEPRVRCRLIQSGQQEVEIRAYTFEEIDRPEFWEIVEKAAKSFPHQGGTKKSDLEAEMPWKKLGKRWHFMPKGFAMRKKVRWPMTMWEELHQHLESVADEAEFEWDLKSRVNIRNSKAGELWASVQTKRWQALLLELHGPKDAFTYGELIKMGLDVELDTSPKSHDAITFSLTTLAAYRRSGLSEWLKQHWQSWVK